MNTSYLYRKHSRCMISFLLASLGVVSNALADEPPAAEAPPSDLPSVQPPLNEPPKEAPPAAPQAAPQVDEKLLYTQPKEKQIWYGLPSVIGMGVSHALIGTLFAGSLPTAMIGALGAGLTGPVVHWANGQVGRGFASLGGNIVATAVGGYGLALATGDGWGGILGGWIGLAAWNIYDVAALHYKVPEKSTAYVSPRYAPSFAIVPMVDPKTKGIAIVGQF